MIWVAAAFDFVEDVEPSSRRRQPPRRAFARVRNRAVSLRAARVLQALANLGEWRTTEEVRQAMPELNVTAISGLLGKLAELHLIDRRYVPSQRVLMENRASELS
jgi:hypothetical protein